MVKNTTCDRCSLKLSTYQKYQQYLNRQNSCRPKNLPQAPIPVQNARNITPEQNLPPAPESDLISFDENPPMLQPTQPREAVDPEIGPSIKQNKTILIYKNIPNGIEFYDGKGK